MPAPTSFNRRTALTATAAAAAAATLGSCSRDESPTPAATNSPGTAAAPSAAPTDGPAADEPGGKTGSQTKPLPTPPEFSESPKLAAQVKAGKLPPVDKRLPEVPYVVPHRWLTRGNYGGDLQMLVSTTTGSAIAEWFYGFSILRLLNDSRDLGPGLAERWQSNDDASVWTFHFRKGLRWSDGHPWSTDDIMFWWKDMANDDAFVGEAVPDECKSGTGKIATLTAVDAHTLEVRYDAPTPLAADRIACWVSGYGGNGASWMVPSHFAKQFHPTYNPKVPKNWAGTGGLFERNVSFRRNPKCPTMTGFRLLSYSDGKSLRWERNPYYYAVSPDGDQLPYLDRLVMTAVQDPEVGKLQVSTGKVDLSYGPFDALQLADVSTLMKGREQYGYDVLLWDSGSGTASMIYFSQDYYEPAYRKLFREPKFRQALSHAFNRKQARRAIYFDQGDITTGTISPKGLEFVSSDAGRNQYRAWRDAYVAFDRAKAKSLLDEIGVVDRDGDGLRELPGGGKLKLRIELAADAGAEHVQKDTQLVRDWKAIGLDVRLNRVPPLSFNDLWAAGKYMTHSNWEAAGPPNSGLINPLWLAPTESSRWAPLQGAMYATRGTSLEKAERNVDPYKRKPPRMEPEKGGPVEKLWDVIDRGATEPDALKRQALFFEAVKVHVKYGPFFQGTVANYPVVVVVRKGLHNVPARENLALGGNVNPWEHPTPACYDPETFYWNEPAKHVV